MKSALTLPPLYQCRNWGTEKLNSCFRSHSYQAAELEFNLRKFGARGPAVAYPFWHEQRSLLVQNSTPLVIQALPSSSALSASLGPYSDELSWSLLMPRLSPCPVCTHCSLHRETSSLLSSTWKTLLSNPSPMLQPLWPCSGQHPFLCAATARQASSPTAPITLSLVP